MVLDAVNFEGAPKYPYWPDTRGQRLLRRGPDRRPTQYLVTPYSIGERVLSSTRLRTHFPPSETAKRTANGRPTP
jgi:hypothetical protein